jgi:hypothetical protein
MYSVRSSNKTKEDGMKVVDLGFEFEVTPNRYFKIWIPKSVPLYLNQHQVFCTSAGRSYGDEIESAVSAYLLGRVDETVSAAQPIEALA